MNDLFLSSDFIQANRVLKLTSPLGDDQLLPERMSVEEGVNQLFEIKLVVRAKREVVKPEELIGNLVTVDVEIAEGLRRPSFSAFQTAGSYMPTLFASCLSFTLSKPALRASYSNRTPPIKIEAVRTRKAIPARFNLDVLRLGTKRDVSRFQPM